MTDSLPSTPPEKTNNKRRDVEVLTKPGYDIYKFHASVYGDCEHRMYRALEFPDVIPSDDSEDNDFVKAMFAAGHKAEDWMKDRLAKFGWDVRGGGTDWKDQVTVSMWGDARFTDNQKDRVLLAGHLDGVISRTTKDGLVVRRLEGKNLGAKGFAALRDDPFAIDQYAWQMSAAAWGNERGEPGDYRKTPHPVLMVVTSKGNYADQVWDKDANKLVPNTLPKEERFFQHLITEPKYTAEQCLDRCRGILKLRRDGICPECTAYYPCRWKRWERDLNTEEADPNVVVASYWERDYDGRDVERKLTLGDLVNIFGNLRAEAKLVGQQLEAAKAELVKGLGVAGIVNGDRRIIGAATVNLSKAGRLTVTGV